MCVQIEVGLGLMLNEVVAFLVRRIKKLRRTGDVIPELFRLFHKYF